MSRWFRVYDGMLDDPATGLLPDKYFKTYIEIMCAVSMHGPQVINEKGFSRYIRVSQRHFLKALALFTERGLLIDGQMKHFRPPSRVLASEWAELRQIVFERDDFTCAYCGQRGGKLECDHIIPHSRGGSDHPANLATACFDCNRAKRDKTPEEWEAIRHAAH